jgi:predicted Fe-S protein YdhL (DUF1289 family)
MLRVRPPVSTRMTARIPDVPSPCIGVCFIDQPSGLCRGCYRSLAEIAGWLEMTPEEKLAALAQLAARKVDYGEL